MSRIEKKIGLVSATTTEFRILIQELNKHGFMDLEEGAISDLRWITGAFEHNKIVLLKSGIGKINAAGATQYLIDNFHPDIVIGIGVAGLLDPTLPIGSVIVTDLCEEWDLNLSASGVQPEKPINHGSFFEKTKDSITDQYLTGVIIAGDTFLADSRQRDELRKKHQALAIDMESVAIARTCSRNKIPYLIIKGFSDVTGINAQAELQSNLEIGVKASFSIFRNLLSKI